MRVNRYKTCCISSLPKSYQRRLLQVLRKKEDDSALIVPISTYVFIVWAIDLPVDVYSRRYFFS